MFSDAQLSEIREKTPIAEVIGEYVELKRAGKNLKGLCPFHSENTPSLIVSPERDTFHCFGCGSGGNVFHFLMKLEGLSFPETVRRLAEKAGVLVHTTPVDGAEWARKEQLFQIQRWAAWYYHRLLQALPRTHAAWQYLTQRQLSEAIVQHFHIGFCPVRDSGLHAYLHSKGFTAEQIQASALYRQQKEFFRDRIIFPIFRYDKKVVGFGGRLYGESEQGPKYLNSPDSEVFKKGELFYGLFLAKEAIRKKERVLIVEGYLDVVTLHAHGFCEAVAPLGTAVGNFQASALKRLNAEVVLCFDADAAGEQAELRALEALLGQGVLPQVVHLEAREDPDSSLRKHGKLAFEKKLGERRNLLEELIDKFSTKIESPPSGLQEKGKQIKRLLAWVEKIPDAMLQRLYRRRIAECFEIPESWVQAIPTWRPRSDETDKKTPSWLPEETVIIEIWLKFPALRDQVKTMLHPEEFVTEEVVHLARHFWQISQADRGGKASPYFDGLTLPLVEKLSALSCGMSGLDEIVAAKFSLEQAAMGLREKRLRRELRDLKKEDPTRVSGLILEKTQALSQVLQNKARIYGERKK